ncbi:MAG: ATP-dependent zinc metalloprotease FtsH [Clostridiales bacterium]|nr:ATP-dependent zinc metalloprotease FtsH [Clostridiales bacterium]
MFKKNNRDKKPGTPRPILYFYGIAFLAVLLLNWLVFPYLTKPKVVEVGYSDFLDKIESNEVTAVEMDLNEISFVVKDPKGEDTYYKTGYVDDPELVSLLRAHNVDFGAVIPSQPNYLLNLLLSYGIPILIFWLIGRRMSKMLGDRMGSGGLSFGKNTGKIYVPTGDKKTFKDVAGQEEAKEALTEVVDYLSRPERYSEIGAKCPRGVLLVGPPGTGKTLMAKAAAGEADVPFFTIAGSEFVEMFVGRGAARVRDLFGEAKKKAPCIVFIDEIDTIGKKRDSGLNTNDEREQTLNQLLAEMDGFEGDSGVILLAATNRPEVLDPALLRPGRFDRQIPVELPDLQGRIAIFQVHAENYKMSRGINYDILGRATAGASGAEIANVVNEASLRAVRMGHPRVTQEDLEESIEVVIAGHQKKNAILSPEEKKVVAYHEIGHALVAAKQTDTAPIHKITIIPRTSGALGYTMQVEENEKSLMTKTETFNRMVTICGGRAAEEVIFEEITTGAANDIEQVTKIARAMVTRFGMSGEFGMMALETQNNIYLGGDSSLACSPKTSELIDIEVKELIQSAYQRAVQILTDNKAKLHELAEFLYNEETITGEQFMGLLNSENKYTA